MPSRKSARTATAATDTQALAHLTMSLDGLDLERLDLLHEAIDSHIYWQLSDERYRRDGYVDQPGSDDPDAVKLIEVAEDLGERILGCMQKLELLASPRGA